tara:strand:- start:52 stop:399 length:348 start_codon:yes stop_codon:yes gene_type:complete
MIASFACKNIDFADIIKCSFNLNKTEYTLFLFLISAKESMSIKYLSDQLNLDRSTIQKAIKSLTEKNIVKRIQTNLTTGGYSFSYTINNKQELKKKVLKSIDDWHNSVKKLIIKW